MKCRLLIILTSSCTSCVGQELLTIRDMVNHFEIGVPVGWRYGVPVDKPLAFMALRQKQNDQDVPKENFNVNILHLDEVDLINSIDNFWKVGAADGFKIIEQGEKVINDRNYK